MLKREEIALERFRVASISADRYASISSCKGTAWITAGEGFSDIVLKPGQSITLLSKEVIVIEALTDCCLTVSCVKDKTPLEAARN